jgi:hypothetical protein
MGNLDGWGRRVGCYWPDFARSAARCFWSSRREVVSTWGRPFFVAVVLGLDVASGVDVVFGVLVAVSLGPQPAATIPTSVNPIVTEQRPIAKRVEVRFFKVAAPCEFRNRDPGIVWDVPQRTQRVFNSVAGGSTPVGIRTSRRGTWDNTRNSSNRYVANRAPN